MAKKCLIIKSSRKPKFSTRAYNRCQLCGRPRAFYRRFRMCRLCLRDLALKGQIPGLQSSHVPQQFSLGVESLEHSPLQIGTLAGVGCRRRQVKAGGIPGNSLIRADPYTACAVEKGAATRRLYLPAGEWYDWWTNEKMAGPLWIERPVDLALTNSFGFGGHNACLALRAWNEG